MTGQPATTADPAPAGEPVALVYAMMPALTRAARGFPYPPQRPEPLEGAP